MKIKSMKSRVRETVQIQPLSHVVPVVKNLPADGRRCKKMQVQSLGQEDPLEKDMATHSSLLAWRVLWTEEPGGL